MATRPMTEVESVRSKVSDDPELTDEQIEQFLMEYNGKTRKYRVYMAAADSIDFLLRELDWNVMRLNNRTVSNNLKVEKSKEYRNMARASNLRFK